MIRLALALPLMAFLTTTATAADCSGASSQQDMNACRAATYHRTDAAMTAAYRKVLASAGPKTRDALRTAQKAWLNYRRTTCGLEELGSEGGSMQPLIYFGCMEEITKERRSRLKTYFNCTDNDPRCVGQFKS